MCVNINLKNIKKIFRDTQVLGGIDMEIKSGEIVAIFGPNGAGKTTLLNIIAGIDTDFTGAIDKVIQSRALGDDGRVVQVNQAYMFQNYREKLFGWRNGWDNIFLPYEITHKISSGSRIGFEQVKNFIHMIFPGINSRLNLNSYPYMYSGGQQQITAFLRTLVNKPNLLLIDEPFSALDYENNLHMRMSMLAYHKKYKPTIIFVTHNIEEAVHMADRIIVLSKKPTVVANVIDNNHGIKKDINFIASPYFNNTKDEILSKFRKVAGI